MSVVVPNLLLSLYGVMVQISLIDMLKVKCCCEMIGASVEERIVVGLQFAVLGNFCGELGFRR